MMKYFIVLCFLCVAIVLVVYAVKAYKIKTPSGREVTGVLGMAAAAIVWYCIALTVHNYFWISFAFSLNFICFDGIVYYLYLFALEYTNAPPVAHNICILTHLLLVCDTVSLLLNAFIGNVVTFSIRHVNEAIYSIDEIKWPYAAHLILCYTLFISCIGHLAVKTYKSAGPYKIKYILPGAVFVVTAFINGLFVFTDLSLDFSVLTYALAAILLYNFTFDYVPRQLRFRILGSIMQATSDGFILFDAEGRCIYKNARFSELFEQDRVIENRSEFCSEGDRCAKNGDTYNGMEEKEIMLHGKNVITLPFCKLQCDENGRCIGSFCWFKDITRESQLRQEKKFLSEYDTLTGIYNRYNFFDLVQKYILLNDRTSIQMLAMDIERFKLINDVLGYETGSLLLKGVAEGFRSIGKEQHRNGKVFYYGRIESDRFAVCVEKSFSVEGLLEACKRKINEIEHITIPIVLKVGVYEVEDPSIPAEIMYDRAMLALNKIKGLYGYNIGCYDAKLRSRLLEEQEILSDMEKAILERQFVVYLQPQMDHHNNHIVGTEALVRWQHPTKGMISPADFIPIFEENGFITKLDQYVWDQVCQIIKKLRESGKKDASISVNISMKDFYFADLYEVFTGLIRKYEIPPQSLKLEITESAFVLDLEKQMDLIKKLQDVGFIIEMDDFGSGYSSLNTLKDIPVNVLKMDMKFLYGCQDMERSKNILQMVVMLSRNLGMKVIAEGVETKNQADYLSSIGCKNIQGYYYARPMAQTDFEEYLDRYDYKDIMKE